MGAAGGWPARHLKVHGRDLLCASTRVAPVYITFGYVNRAAARDGPPRESTENRRLKVSARAEGQGTIRPPYRPAGGAQCVTWEGRGGARGTPLCMPAACPPPTLLAHPAAGAARRSLGAPSLLGLHAPRSACARWVAIAWLGPPVGGRGAPRVTVGLGICTALGERRVFAAPRRASSAHGVRRGTLGVSARQVALAIARGQRWTATQRQRARGA